MTAQPRGPVRVAIMAARTVALKRTEATERALREAVQHAHAIEEQRILEALQQRGPMKFRTLCRRALPGCGDGVVNAALQRLLARGAVYCWPVRPPIWSLTMHPDPSPETTP